MNGYITKMVTGINGFLFLVGGILVPVIIVISGMNNPWGATTAFMTAIGVFVGVLFACAAVAFLSTIIDQQKKQIELLETLISKP
ncbi:MAG: hypothetical protein ACOZEN_06940 [Thermodesulfobacteriota bacterium]